MAKAYKALKDCQYRDAGGKIRFAKAGEMVEFTEGMPDLPPCFEGFVPRKKQAEKAAEKTGEPSELPKFDRMNIAELEAYAAEKQISLEGCDTRAKRIEAIKKALGSQKDSNGPGF
jgi:hypothetical protein